MDAKKLLVLAARILHLNTRMRFRRAKLFVLLKLLRLSNQQQQTIIWEYFNKLYLPRRVWKLERVHTEFEDNYFGAQPDLGYWRKNFRMSRDTFEYLVTICRPFMQKENTNFRLAIPAEKRLAVALSWLANGSTQRHAGFGFGVPQSTAQIIIKDFISGLFKLRKDFIKFPNSQEEVEKVILSFKDKTLLPNVCGAVDGTHIEIIKPSSSAIDYFSRKQSYTITNQAICDGNMIFLAVDSGFPGATHDSRMLRNTWIYTAVNSGEILQAPLFQLTLRKSIKPYILGDPAYTLSNWLMKPYAHFTKVKVEKDFNYQLSRARVIIERAFGLLKGRWRILQSKLNFPPEKASEIFVVCCILHNILENHGEVFDIDDNFECNQLDVDSSRETDGSSEILRSSLSKYIQTCLSKKKR